MKRTVTMLVFSFICGVATSLTAISVSAGSSAGSVYAYSCNGYNYYSSNGIETDTNSVRGTAMIRTDSPVTKIPAGYAGIQANVYKAGSLAPYGKTDWKYNSGGLFIFTVSTLNYPATKGTYYSQGLTSAYDPKDFSNEVYTVFSTYTSPYQVVN